MAFGPSPYDTAITQTANQYGIDPKLFRALVGVESSFQQSAISPAGAIGLTQLMPATAAGLGVDPYDPNQNLAGGANYLSQMLQRAGGDPATAVMYYNCGPGNTCPAGQAEAVKVLSNAGMTSGAIGAMWGQVQSDISGQTSPATPNYQPSDATPLGGIWGKLGNVGFIMVGALLVILAMAIPNRKLVVQTVGAVK